MWGLRLQMAEVVAEEVEEAGPGHQGLLHQPALGVVVVVAAAQQHGVAPSTMASWEEVGEVGWAVHDGMAHHLHIHQVTMMLLGVAAEDTRRRDLRSPQWWPPAGSPCHPSSELEEVVCRRFRGCVHHQKPKAMRYPGAHPGQAAVVSGRYWDCSHRWTATPSLAQGLVAAVWRTSSGWATTNHPRMAVAEWGTWVRLS